MTLCTACGKPHLKKIIEVTDNSDINLFCSSAILYQCTDCKEQFKVDCVDLDPVISEAIKRNSQIKLSFFSYFVVLCGEEYKRVTDKDIIPNYLALKAESIKAIVMHDYKLAVNLEDSKPYSEHEALLPKTEKDKRFTPKAKPKGKR